MATNSRAVRSVGVCLLVATSLLTAAKGVAQTEKQAPGPAKTAADEEVAARDFVRRHHPELDALLDKLKLMNPVEYEKVVGDLYRTSETLRAMQGKEPARYELALNAWKAKSRVERLGAEVVRKRSAESEGALREALAALVDAEIAQKKFERDALETRLRRLNEQIGKQEAERESQIETRLKRITKGRPATKTPKSEKANAAGKDSPKRNETP